jgi:mono/diheme cytochrome c family protein
MKRRYVALLITTAALAAFGLGVPRLRKASADDSAQKLFNAQCSSCHGTDGRGQTTAGKHAGVKDWTAGTTLKALSDAEIAKIIREGRKDTSGKETMPSFQKLSDDQVKALVASVRSFQK